jgi:6-phosphogluconolactonase
MAQGGIFVYVSFAERTKEPRGEIWVYELDPGSGKLTLVQQIETTGKAMPMALTPDRRFLYCALRSEPYSVAAYAVDGLTGKLTHLATTPIPGSMAWLSTDHTGRYLFASAMPDVQYSTTETEPRQSLVSVSAIGANGVLQPAHQMIRTEPFMHSILADPANRFVIAMCRNGDQILRYAFDEATGMLCADGLAPVRVKPNAHPRHFLFHPNNRTLYLLTEADANIYVYDYDGVKGALNERQLVAIAPASLGEQKPHSADLHITPDGRFLYATERRSNTVVGFEVDLNSGFLNLIGHTPTEEWPRGFNIDPYGRHMIVAGQISNSLTSYAIDRANGSLKPIERYPTAGGPNWIEIVRLP